MQNEIMRVIEVVIKSRAGLHILKVAGNTKKNHFG